MSETLRPAAVDAADRARTAAFELLGAIPLIDVPFDTHAVTRRLTQTVSDLSAATRGLATWHTAHPQDAQALQLADRLVEASAALADARNALAEVERISQETRWPGRLA